jgi:isocitrate/isopropylmalate dehydrogenase
MSVLKKLPIAVARGDGIGPEIMSACLKIFEGEDIGRPSSILFFFLGWGR